jgi:hypothetical protein
MQKDSQMLRPIGIGSIVVAGMLATASLCVPAAEGPSLNDMARFLAGMPPVPGLPLQKLARDEQWRRHASDLDSAFDSLERQQLGKIREWSSTRLTASQSTIFYFFSGPDFMYADAFFPKAAIYVLSGLEAVGHVPDLMTLRGKLIAQTLKNIEVSLTSFLSVGYFITPKMETDLSKGPVRGILPLLYVFLARSGKVIHGLNFLNLDKNGNPESNIGSRNSKAAQGVKIDFTAPNGELKTLYYFSADVADDSNNNNALLEFCERQGLGDTLLKSASYLVHKDNYSQVRTFLLQHSAVIVQDDTGIPVADFDTRIWHLVPFGRYKRPIHIFEEYYQPKLTELFRQQHPEHLDFDMGYQPDDGSNLLVAEKIATRSD